MGRKERNNKLKIENENGKERRNKTMCIFIALFQLHIIQLILESKAEGECFVYDDRRTIVKEVSRNELSLVNFCPDFLKVMHHSYENTWSILESKWHDPSLVLPSMRGMKCCLEF